MLLTVRAEVDCNFPATAEWDFRGFVGHAFHEHDGHKMKTAVVADAQDRV